MELGSAWAPGHGVTQTGPEHQSYQAIKGIPTFLFLLRSRRTTPLTQQPIWHSLQHPSILQCHTGVGQLHDPGRLGTMPLPLGL